METKICSKCLLEKPLSEFNASSKKKSLLRSDCKSCTALWRKEYYLKNRDSIKARNLKYRQSSRIILKARMHEYKSLLGCCVCGEKDSACLDFHHTGSDEKKFSIGKVTTRVHDWSVVMAEIEKCVLLCSNCHRKYHAGHLSLPTRVGIGYSR
jgi:transcription elongation factor Elf1